MPETADYYIIYNEGASIMSFAGDYRLASMKKLKSDDSGFEDVAIEVILSVYADTACM